MTKTRPPLTVRGWLRWEAVEPFLRRFPPGSRMLEVGCGTGGLASRVAHRFDYTGLELDGKSWQLAVSRLERVGRGHVINGDTSALEAQAPFDLVCAFEVLEHIEDDAGELAEWRRWLAPDGALLVSVPAFRRRFGASDRHVGHYRRYDPSDLAAVVRDAGFGEPEIQVYGFPLDFLGEFVRNSIARFRASEEALPTRTAASGRFLQPPEALGWVTRGITAPFRVLQRPFRSSSLGTGLVAFARIAAA